ncbi:putative nuclease HARBI1 [Trifolium pratense]|uniref:putative nuclease HARBI1 n=1 Tax=Trifolium pratense TaxID=57577 RepID=UPI001E68FE64|nr:putative nuclease HARBI1 [Trifolium pratense]
MDPNIEWDNIWNEVIDDCLNDNTEEEVIRLVREAQQQPNSTRRRRKRRTVIDRSREEGHNRLFNDYFSENPVYTEAQFRRRFRMRRHVFLRIVEALGNHDEYFQTRTDAVGKMGLSPLQKCTAALRILAYGSPADSVDDYVRIGESTTLECLDRFVMGVCTIFGAQYMRRPNNEDIARLLQINAARGFPGMLGSIDCMHWEWKNCPVAWKGQFFRGDHGKPTIMLEVVASQDLWIWHAYFGTAGSNNDINVLNTSDVFNDVLSGKAPAVQYTVNRTTYHMGYYLADGIYPEWAIFVKTIPMPQGEKRKLFAQRQESARKDVERAFGVLQARFAIVRGPARAWHVNTMKHIMLACIILHNMIVEDERDTYAGNFDYDHNNNFSTIEVSAGPDPNLTTLFERIAHVHERKNHRQLQADLVEHIWERFGHENNES